MNPTQKIIVLDDDPTGSQTVHGCLLLTRWDVATLQLGLRDAAPLFFILTNTRALDGAHAAAVTCEVCRNLKQALADTDIQPIIISRSDSTLRGHYPLETDVIAEEMGPFDAHFLIPAFFEGGRVTRDSVHYLKVDGKETPVHETEFARDSVFGYRHSYLPAYVEEKTQGRTKASEVERFLLQDSDAGLLPRLLAMRDNRCAVVDAESYNDLTRFTRVIQCAIGQGKRFLFRSAASLVAALAALPPPVVAAEAMGRLCRDRQPGVVIVGSHVAKTSRQLVRLLQETGTVGIELDVARLPEAFNALCEEAVRAADQAFRSGKTGVIYTSRAERRFDSAATQLAFGENVSRLLMEILRRLPREIGFVISKGGITSHDTLSKGLALSSVRLIGQIAPGCSLVCCPPDHALFPNLPVVIFPGNVGEDDTLAQVYRSLESAHATLPGS